MENSKRNAELGKKKSISWMRQTGGNKALNVISTLIFLWRHSPGVKGQYRFGYSVFFNNGQLFLVNDLALCFDPFVHMMSNEQSIQACFYHK